MWQVQRAEAVVDQRLEPLSGFIRLGPNFIEDLLIKPERDLLANVSWLEVLGGQSWTCLTRLTPTWSRPFLLLVFQMDSQLALKRMSGNFTSS